MSRTLQIIIDFFNVEDIGNLFFEYCFDEEEIVESGYFEGFLKYKLFMNLNEYEILYKNHFTSMIKYAVKNLMFINSIKPIHIDFPLNGNIKLAKYLLKLNVKRYDFFLYNLCIEEEKSVEKILIKHNYDYNKLISFAYRNGLYNLIEYGVDNGASDLHFIFYESASKNDVSSIEFIINNGFDDIEWALYKSCWRYKSKEIADLCIQNGANKFMFLYNKTFGDKE